MPHRVVNFLESLENPVSNLKKSVTKKTVAHGAKSKNSRRLERVFSYASSIDGDTDRYARPKLKMARSRSNSDSDGHKEHHHRISFPHFGRTSSKDNHAQSNASLNCEFESPPIVFYGDVENSSGALVSGQLWLEVKEDEMEIEFFDAKLNIHVAQKRPFTTHCPECINQFTELKKWIFLQHPVHLKRGRHGFPFSILLGGHLPTTTDGPVMSIAYEFKAEAIPKRSGHHAPPSIKFDRVLDVKRSLQAPEAPHHSVRVFPPTNIKASVHYPQVIYPIGSNNLALKLDGITKRNALANTIEYWKLKKLTWRLEETARTASPACPKHTPREVGDSSAKKNILRSDMRVIGERTIFSGWKSDYGSVSDSSIELNLDYCLNHHAKYSYDLNSKDGSEVTHQLMVEMVVSQEWAPINKPSLVTQTGVGRILRMHFSTVLTERGGIGISWDNEAPPIYQDVPPSPPPYDRKFREQACDEAAIDPQPLDGIRLSERPARLSMDDFDVQDSEAASRSSSPPAF